MTEPKGPPKWPQIVQLGTTVSQTGFVIAGSALMGHWLDTKFGWSPWGLLAGILFGTVGGFRIMVFLLRKMGEDGRGQAKDSEPPAGRRD